MELCDREHCTGCSACANVCPARAIQMVVAEDGFAYPEIGASHCTNCGMCRKVCPELSKVELYSRPIESHAVMAADEVRAVSSSGGVFSLLAESCLEGGGVVYGAAFDDKLQLRHIRVASVIGLGALRGSKYLQSAIGYSFRQVREDLNMGRKVLFVGTPCQIAGLRNYLRHDFENLLLVDLICHGVPSQKAFDAYLKEQSPDDPVVGYDFRNKRDGWGGAYLLLLLLLSGKKIYRKDADDDYMCAFLSGLMLRPSCYNCQYAQMRRVGDITIGDYWGAGNEAKEDDDKKGTSLVFLNTPKAELFWKNHIGAKLKLDNVRDPAISERIQPQLKAPAAQHPCREEFLKDMKTIGFKGAVSKNMCHEKSVAILNFHWENVNFGAVLTAFALNRYLCDEGYFVQNIDYIPSFDWIAAEKPNARFEAFRTHNLPRTKRIKAGEDLSFLNECFRNFIVGSDQVWRPAFIKNERDAYLLAFAGNDKTLISCAASFGTEDLDVSERERKEYALRLARFDHISVREKSGVKICRDLGISATQIVDPVFLLESCVWNELADSYAGTDASEFVYYTIDDSKEQEFRNFINGEAKNLTFDVGVEEWLWRIKNAKLLVTDSYHGSCFAIIFNRPFVCINPNTQTQTRMRSLFEQLGIKNHLYSDFGETSVKEVLNAGIDWSSVNSQIEALREKARQFLLGALQGGGGILSPAQKRSAQLKLCLFILKGARLRRFIMRLKFARYSMMKTLTSGKRSAKYAKKATDVKAQLKKMKRQVEEARNVLG